MKKSKFFLHLSVALSLSAAPFVKSHADDYETNWSYNNKGADGPSNWGKLSPKYKACSLGEEQSPVDINTRTAIRDKKLPTIEFKYKDSILDLENDGHWVEVDIKKGSSLLINGKSYRFTQVHFHTPSEHTLNGKPVAAEAHFVHELEKGKGLVVVGLFIREGKENKAYEPILSRVPAAPHSEREYKDVKFNAMSLLPKAPSQYYYYDGSLTTPPCSEPVKWFIFKNEIELSAAQIKKLSSLYDMNVRPIMPIGKRKIFKDF